MDARTSPDLVALELTRLSRDGVPILGALSLRVSAGESVAILGPSGIGKTTLLRVISGLHQDFEGDLKVTKKVAFMFQEPTLLPWRSAIENVAIAAGCSTDAAMDGLASVGLADKAELFPGQMSLGQQRRLSFARALATNADVLLMDEPFVSLDAALADEMRALFLALRKELGFSVLFVTHDQREAQMLATRVITLAGSPATIFADEAVSR